MDRLNYLIYLLFEQYFLKEEVYYTIFVSPVDLDSEKNPFNQIWTDEFKISL